MSDAQTWTLIIGTLTVQVALVGAALGVQTRWIKAEVGRLADRLDALADRIDKLDRDVHAVIVHLMGEGR